jgi:hypothetical protein
MIGGSLTSIRSRVDGDDTGDAEASSSDSRFGMVVVMKGRVEVSYHEVLR